MNSPHDPINAANDRHDPDLIKRVVADAMNLPAPQRPAFISDATRNNDSLRAEIEKLVAALDAAGNFMNAVTGTAAANNPSSELTAHAASLHQSVGTAIGPYKLRQLIGEGGFGSVFMADQTEPVRRRVALKIIKLGMDTRQVVARFEAERQVLALMDHPHIARVFDGGLTDPKLPGGGRPYFVMEYVVGDSISDFADAHRLNLPDRLALFSQVCQAVQHAHTKGIIHRDLKPGNVLVSLVDGRPFAKVIDFGIAKSLSSPMTEKSFFTEHRQLIGTPEYMSPEQAEGSPDIDTRTDVYALGVLLYELLTSATPFDAKRLRSAAFAEMQRIIKEEEPPKPSVKVTALLQRPLPTKPSGAGFQPASSPPSNSSGTGVPPVSPPPTSSSSPTPLFSPRDLQGELDWIVMKALDKDRARRYESPNQLAADVQRHLSGEAVVAAPPTMGYRVRKFVKRNKGKVIAGSAVAAALLVGIAGTTWQWKIAKSRSALVAEANSRLRLNVNNAKDGLLKVMNELAGDNGFRIKLPEGFGGQFCSEEEATPEHGPRFRMGTKDGNIVTLNISAPPNGRRKMTDVSAEGPRADEYLMALLVANGVDGARDSKAKRIELETEKENAEWSAYTANLALAQFEMDSGNWQTARDRIAACPESKRGWEWRLVRSQTQTVITEFRGHTNSVFSAVFSPDGTRIITASADRTARIWDATAGVSLAEFKGHTDGLRSAAFSPDGKRIVTASDDQTARVWDAATGLSFTELKGHTSDVYSAAFSPDGTRILTASADGNVGVWDTAKGTGLANLKSHASWVYSAAFSPDGTRIVTASEDGTAAVWDAATGLSNAVLKRHRGSVHSAAFSPDGTRIVTASADWTARIWDAATGIGLAKAKGHSVVVRSAAFSPDGTRIVTASDDYTARVWDAATGVGLAVLQGHTGEVYSAAFSPDGTRIVTASVDNTARVWDASTDKALIAAENPRHVFGSMDSDGEWIEENEVELRLAVIRAASSPRPVATEIATPDGSRRIVGSADGTIRFFDAPRPDFQLAAFRIGHPISGLEMTPDGSRLLIWVAEGLAEVWDIRDPAERLEESQLHRAERVPAGEYLDALWDRTAAELPTAKISDAIVNDAALTPLRRLVAVEMLDEKRADLDDAVRDTFGAITKDRTDPAAVQAAAKAADLPPRVREEVVAKAAKWEYKKPEPTEEENLAARNAKLLEDAEALENEKANNFGPGGPWDFAEILPQQQKIRDIYRQVYGPEHVKTITAGLELELYTTFQGNFYTLRVEQLVELMKPKIDAYQNVAGIERAARMYWTAGHRYMGKGRYRAAKQWFEYAHKCSPQTESLTDLDIAMYVGLSAKSMIHELVDRHDREPTPEQLLEFFEDTQAMLRENNPKGLESFQLYAQEAHSRVRTRLAEHAEALQSAVRSAELHPQAGKSPSMTDLTVLALIHFKLSTAADAPVGEVPPSTPAERENHLVRAREALAKARAVMTDPAHAQTWATKTDAMALFEEAVELIEGVKAKEKADEEKKEDKR